MALRTQAGHVLSIRACAREMAHGRLSLVERRTASSIRSHTPGVCPVHEITGCVETYLSASRVASWSLRGFWSWRSRMRTWGES